MAKESKEELKARAKKIIAALAKAYTDAHCHLKYSNPLEMAVATILAAQCTDAKVNEVTATLFKKYRAAKDYAATPQDALEAEIRPTGFYRNKAKSVRKFCAAIIEKHGGKVPGAFDELVALPGIGRKSANLILACSFGKPGIIVDTHVRRVAPRLGLTQTDDPEKIAADLDQLVPEKERAEFSFRLADHGRAICHPRKPEHDKCPLSKLCPSVDI